MTVTAADDLRANLIGAWTLESYESHSLDGPSVSYPLGPDAQGIIMYTPDGYMSAQRMHPRRTPFHLDDPHLAGEDELAAQDSRLQLSPPEPTLIHGEHRNAELIWRRA